MVLQTLLHLFVPREKRGHRPRRTAWLAGAMAFLLVSSGCQTKNKGKRSQKNRSAAVKKTQNQPQNSRSLGRHSSYKSVSTSSPVVALTFDDGPHPENTPRLLDILRSRQVKATFFVTGKNSQRYPSILRRISLEGHEIGNHTMTHDKITQMSQSQIRYEIGATSQAVRSATGVSPRSFRPPYGATSEGLNSWIKKEFGLPSILWSVDPQDWKKPGVNVVTSRLVNGANRGGILLLHDIHASSVAATPGAIDQLKRRGFRFLTVSQLIELEP